MASLVLPPAEYLLRLKINAMKITCRNIIIILLLLPLFITNKLFIRKIKAIMKYENEKDIRININESAKLEL